MKVKVRILWSILIIGGLILSSCQSAVNKTDLPDVKTEASSNSSRS